MKDYVEKIYNILHSPIVTPYNLLENVKLPNYEYVNYSKSDRGLITEMKCTLDDGSTAIFYYHFDNNDYLQHVYMFQEGKEQLVFDRQSEFKKLVSRYQKDPAAKQSLAI